MKSSLDLSKAPRHVAIIMDGNGRWARARGQPRLAGHCAGAKAVRRTVEAAPDLGVEVLTLFAFSADNWRRPSSEVSGLLRLFERYLQAEAEACRENGVRVSVLGRRDRLSSGLLQAVSDVEATTRAGATLWLRLAIDYSGRGATLEAARCVSPEVSPAEFARFLAGPEGPAPDVDLLIRTGGEKRLSDFMLWESAYAEIYFTGRRWPEFTGEDLAQAIDDFRHRERRFGGLPARTPRVATGGGR